MAVRDTPTALLDHVAAVLTTRDHPERAQRVDFQLLPDLAGRLGRDHAERFEAMVAVALTSLDMIEARRARDLMLARGRPDRAQPHGGRLCVAERTILDLIQVLVAPVAPHDTTGSNAGTLKDQADARAEALAPLYAEALQQGCSTDRQVAAFMNEREIPAAGPGPWTEPRAASLRRRLTKMGLSSLVLSLPKPAVRQVRTRTPRDTHTLEDDTYPDLEGRTSHPAGRGGFRPAHPPAS